ncbi:MAG: cytochrome b/b6 domain-containing protein, partial [Novosphingobium sp.]
SWRGLQGLSRSVQSSRLMAAEMRRTALWDLPVRLVHWSFVALLPALWWTAHHGKIDLHKTLGLTMLGLVVFRVLWGIVGSESARFSKFVRGPAAVIAYLRDMRGGAPALTVGHNPVGGWSVVLLLALLAAQVIIGLFTQDVDGIESGPLNYLVSYDTAETLRGLHELGFNLILLFVIVHIAAVIYYTLVKKDRLIKPMITGAREFPDHIPAPRMAPLWRAIPLILFAVALAWWIGKGAPRSLAQLNAEPAPAAEDYM